MSSNPSSEGLSVSISPFSDEGVRSWLVSQLKALCGWTPPQEEKEAKQVQQRVLSSKDTGSLTLLDTVFFMSDVLHQQTIIKGVYPSGTCALNLLSVLQLRDT